MVNTVSAVASISGKEYNRNSVPNERKRDSQFRIEMLSATNIVRQTSPRNPLVKQKRSFFSSRPSKTSGLNARIFMDRMFLRNPSPDLEAASSLVQHSGW